MPNASVRPSTIEGVKSLAAQIKRERGIQHMNALNAAAAAARCENFTHARRVLPSREQPARLNRIFLTIYWHDDKVFRYGRETLQVELSKPILDICSKADLRRVRGFGAMRMVAEDHLVSDMLAGSQDQARRTICMAVRSLRFMEHTGLRPSRDPRGEFPGRDPSNRLPDCDHSTDWHDPATGRFVLVDEPYGGAPDHGARAAWAGTHGWNLAKSSWPGMYYPHKCELHVACEASDALDFGALMARSTHCRPRSCRWTGPASPSTLSRSSSRRPPEPRRTGGAPGRRRSSPRSRPAPPCPTPRRSARAGVGRPVPCRSRSMSRPGG